MRFEKRARDAKTNRLSLSGEAAAFNFGGHIVLAFAPDEDERLFKVGDQGGIGHVFAHFNTIDGDEAFAGLEVDTGDRGFPTTGPIVFRNLFSHGCSPYFLRSRTTGF